MKASGNKRAFKPSAPVKLPPAADAFLQSMPSRIFAMCERERKETAAAKYFVQHSSRVGLKPGEMRLLDGKTVTFSVLKKENSQLSTIATMLNFSS